MAWVKSVVRVVAVEFIPCLVLITTGVRAEGSACLRFDRFGLTWLYVFCYSAWQLVKRQTCAASPLLLLVEHQVSRTCARLHTNYILWGYRCKKSISNPIYTYKYLYIGAMILPPASTLRQLVLEF